MNFRRRRRGAGRAGVLLAAAAGALLGVGGKAWYERATTTVSGTVIDAATEQPLPNAHVRWQHLTTRTDAQGRFTLVGVDKTDPDTPLVLAGNGYETVRVLPAEAGQVVALRPDTVEGLVLDRSGRPVPRARVSAGDSTVLADDRGAFTIDGVAQNPSLRIVAPGYKTVTVQPGTRRRLRVTLDPFATRGLYLAFGAAHTPGVREAWLRHLDRLQLNTVVIDVTSDRGHVTPAVATDLNRQAGAVLDGGEHLGALVKELRGRNLYLIARIVVFKDTPAASARPEWAVRVAATGAPYVDCEGQRWLDPFNPAVWEYKLEQAERAADLGFHEVQFDYVRFPSDCITSPLAYGRPHDDAAKLEGVEGFLKRAMERLRPRGIALSADVFGLVATEDDIGIGQRLEGLARYVDYVSPMVYPSTWANGAFDLPYPPADPYAVVRHSVGTAVQRLAGSGVAVRPWLQAFDDYKEHRLPYQHPQVAAQVRAAEEAGANGWLLWDPFGRYPLDDAPQLGG